jgi:hypothetical protein
MIVSELISVLIASTVACSGKEHKARGAAEQGGKGGNCPTPTPPRPIIN